MCHFGGSFIMGRDLGSVISLPTRLNDASQGNPKPRSYHQPSPPWESSLSRCRFSLSAKSRITRPGRRPPSYLLCRRAPPSTTPLTDVAGRQKITKTGIVSGDRPVVGCDQPGKVSVSITDIYLLSVVPRVDDVVYTIATAIGLWSMISSFQAMSTT